MSSLDSARAPVVRLDADASWHAGGVSQGRVSLLVDNRADLSLEVLAHGRPEEVDEHPAAAGAHRVSLPGHVLLPGLVNAHTHLDLTHLGPHEWDPARSFTEWVAIIRAGRRTEEQDIAASVRRGAALAIAGGTAIVGDIAGAVRATPTTAASRALGESGLRGVSFLEFFAIGPRAAATVAALSERLEVSRGALGPGLTLGLQPHATNTVDPEGYLSAVDFAVHWGLPLSTHLAESPEERQFIGHGTGPQRALLESVGAWDDSLLRVFGQGKHPVEHLSPALREARLAYRPFLAAHVNDATDGALEVLAATRTSVAYCPRASAYFGAERHFGPHRYRDMLRAGINVCLGTDSVVNITDGTVGRKKPRLSVLDEMRLLFRRDEMDPLALVQMGTTNGARALGMGSHHVKFGEGDRPLAVLAVPVGEAKAGATGPEAVRAVLGNKESPISILTRIVPI